MNAAAAILLLAASAQYGASPVPDHQLAAARGGFQLPNGIDVAITVQTQTVVDGAVVLRTVFQADHGTPTLATFVPKPGTTVAAPATTEVAGGSAAPPSVIYDGRGHIQVTPAAVLPAVAIGSAPPTGADQATGLVEVDATRGAVTDAGPISRVDRSGIDTVRLDAPDLTITHFFGNAFGSAIANSGNDRTIDTSTTVSIDLRNAGPDVLGSSMMRVQDISIDAMRGRL